MILTSHPEEKPTPMDPGTQHKTRKSETSRGKSTAYTTSYSIDKNFLNKTVVAQEIRSTNRPCEVKRILTAEYKLSEEVACRMGESVCQL